MNRIVLHMLYSIAFGLTFSSGAGAADGDSPAEEILALERGALDLWVTGDPRGYLDLYAPEITYFDPFRKRRVDGLGAMRAAFAARDDADSQSAERSAEPQYVLVEPNVQLNDEIAVLTFNFVGGQDAGNPLLRWNATEVYRRIEGQWKIIHSHWSLTTPELPAPP